MARPTRIKGLRTARTGVNESYAIRCSQITARLKVTRYEKYFQMTQYMSTFVTGDDVKISLDSVYRARL